jgi:hypothetical protein
LSPALCLRRYVLLVRAVRAVQVQVVTHVDHRS